MESVSGGASPDEFLNVPLLLERSYPLRRINGSWLVLGFFLLVIVAGAVAGEQSGETQQAIQWMSMLGLLGLMGYLSFTNINSARRYRAEQQEVAAIEELVQLRHWSRAAIILQHLLSRPTRSMRTRTQAMVYLAAVLARYHRFGEAIEVQTRLLEEGLVDPATAYGLKLGRAMAMLHEDHLVDADQAISELRHGPGRDSGGLSMVEIYRDVKTGHPHEAIAMFPERLGAMREQLGHRLGDVYGLLASAYDQLGQTAEAQDAYEKATRLVPPAELQRRYTEVAKLAERYRPAAAPAEMMRSTQSEEIQMPRRDL